MNVKLKKAIWESGLKQYEVAARAGLTPVKLSRILYGGPADAAQRKRLAEVLGKDEAKLFKGNGG